ncbi:hypothetical protein [Promicromonospora xylanilytica]
MRDGAQGDGGDTVRVSQRDGGLNQVTEHPAGSSTHSGVWTRT